MYAYESIKSVFVVCIFMILIRICIWIILQQGDKQTGKDIEKVAKISQSVRRLVPMADSYEVIMCVYMVVSLSEGGKEKDFILQKCRRASDTHTKQPWQIDTVPALKETAALLEDLVDVCVATSMRKRVRSQLQQAQSELGESSSEAPTPKVHTLVCEQYDCLLFINNMIVCSSYTLL
jgi:hypothetical protein